MTRPYRLLGYSLSLLAVAFACKTKSLKDDPRDQNGDGVADDLGTSVDVDGDGEPDVADCNMDGVADGIGVDVDNDNILDAVGIDSDGDGLVDALDTNCDGVPDTTSELPGPGTGGGTGDDTATTGGASSTGGGASTGGTTPVGPRPLPEGWTGFLSYKISDSTVTSIFDEWKENHVEACGGNARVKRGPEDSNDTVSEGQAYGMLIAVGHGDQALFDQLWGFYKANSTNGLMPWKLSGCSGVQDSNNATDAELDAAMALIQAACKFGSDTYKQDAASMLGAVISQLSASKGGNGTLLAGKTGFDGDCLNASYVAPGYYRAFAGVDTANAATWNDLAADSYALLNGVANGSTGLVPDWSGNCGAGKSANYTYDAARTPWRVITDYLWYGTPAAKTFADRMTNWVEGQPDGLPGIRDGYTTSGTKTGMYVNAAFTGAFAVAAASHSQERADDYAQVLNNIRGSNYFGRSLKAIYGLLATGQFDKSCY